VGGKTGKRVGPGVRDNIQVEESLKPGDKDDEGEKSGCICCVCIL
jgi:hypothetical protein